MRADLRHEYFFVKSIVELDIITKKGRPQASRPRDQTRTHLVPVCLAIEA